MEDPDRLLELVSGTQEGEALLLLALEVGYVLAQAGKRFLVQGFGGILAEPLLINSKAASLSQSESFVEVRYRAGLFEPQELGGKGPDQMARRGSLALQPWPGTEGAVLLQVNVHSDA